MILMFLMLCISITALSCRYFPFDEQTCHIVLESWAYPKSVLTVQFKEGMEETYADYHNSSEWELIRVTRHYNTKDYGCCSEHSTFMTLIFSVSLYHNSNI